ncbi:MAG: sigma-70 region 4 domain-containing protein [Candidatus Latescibacteria bacterium]|jgi:DNA-directed RNA polymerase specialized sigma24 family protein|nr:sigma-70 region 4 domain-containing protein [Candidatus Latescibacterota bacterium]
MAPNRLPEPNRQALTMYYLGESSIKEVGRALGTSSQAAKMPIHRARKQLQKDT